MNHVEWGHLSTWTIQVDPMLPKMEVVSQVMGNCNTDKVRIPPQDQRSVEVVRKTHQIIDSQDHFDP